MNIRKMFIVSLVLLLLAGCSSPQDNTPEGPAVLRVGMECNYAPFNWTTTTPSDTTVPITSVDYADGFDVVIASMLAEKTGMQVQIVKLDWDNLIPALQHDQIDAVIAGMTDTPLRRESVDFTTPYYVSEEVIIIRKDSPLASIDSIAALRGYKVQGQMNTIYDEIIDQIDGVVHAIKSNSQFKKIKSFLELFHRSQ
jgi:putative lysine transport system substrate-binding protein/putative lysine transport system permease protein